MWGAIQKKLQNRQFWRASGLLMTANFIALTLGLIRMPIITRLLTKAEVGMLGIIAVYLPFVQLFSMSGMNGASYHYITKGFPAAIRENIRITFGWSLLGVLGWIAGGLFFWFVKGEVLLGGLFLVNSIFFPIIHSLNGASGYFGAKEQFGRLFWFRVAEATSRYMGVLLLLIFSLRLTSYRIVWFSFSNLLAMGLTLLLFCCLIFREDNVEASMPAFEKSEMKKYGYHLTLLGSISTIQTRVDGLLMAALMPLWAVADYSVAQIIYTQFKRLWTVYYTVRYPIFMKLNISRRQRRIAAEMGLLIAGFSLLWLALMLLLNWSLSIILTDEYRSSLPYIGWLLGAFIVSIPGFGAEMYFRSLEQERSLYLLRGISAIFSIICPLIFIVPFQGVGIVMGRFVAGIALSITGVFIVWQHNEEIS